MAVPQMRILIDTTKAKEKVAVFGRAFEQKTYLKLVGLRLLGWVNENFRKEGIEKPWKPLSANTLAARRMAGRGARILRDTGRMAQSFTFWISPQGNADEVFVGTQDQKASIHQFGTGPYTIRPRTKPFLFFQVADGSFRRTSVVNHPGIVARPMLPSTAVAGKLATDEMTAYVEKLSTEAEQK